MKYSNFLSAIFLFLIVITNYHCANIVPPSGGERDKEAPVLLKASPEMATTNFKSKKVILEFDEFFNLDNPIQNIIISPPMTKLPEYTIVGKKLIITFKEPLLNNVTYNINFGDAIKDFNEGNILKNFSYVFATGTILDTFQLNGFVSNANTNIPSESVVVGLYKTLNDSIVLSSKPYYFAKTDNNGAYQIKNIHQGTYKVIALKDENLDYLYNNGEWIGFNKDLTIEDANPIAVADFKIFKAQDEQLKLLDVVNPEFGLIKFIYNKPVKNFKFDAAMYKTTDIAIINSTKDTISYYYSSYETKNEVFYITTNNDILDTVKKELYYLKDNEIEKNKIKFKTLTSTSASNKSTVVKQDAKQNIYEDLVIEFNRPIHKLDSNLVIIIEDTMQLDQSKYHWLINPKDPTKLILKYALHSNTNYTILFKMNAITDNWQVTNDELSKKITTLNSEDYGSIIINNQLISDRSFLLQVFNASGDIIYNQPIQLMDNNKKIILGKLPAGAYKVIVIEDLNKNKRWDTGNYFQKVQAEKIYSINSNLVIKPGWDAEVDIKL